ncbi:hypothetical protein KSP39_PZI020370 [Platanthera zijinensis]|uniref:Uncharacterized protein n=1 Tax=Platanthera zijinensis TaxID=2320716 RepID=A0AAP0FXF0_9ASPA
MHNQIFPEFQIDPNVAPLHLNPIAQQSSAQMPSFSPRPENFEAPPAEYSQVWSYQEMHQIPPPEIPAHKKRKYGDGAFASRSTPMQEHAVREFAEIWSPTSKSLILDTLKLVIDFNENRNDHYNSHE